MSNDRVTEIREAEKQSHIEIYSSTELFTEGSWLQKPVKTVLDIIPLISEKKDLRVLDLGCGIGRNCIPIAKAFSDLNCRIDCIDILDLAIEKLYQNAEYHSVSSNINGVVSSIEDYPILPNSYDLIIAVSALEHTNSKESFINKLNEIERGLTENGIVCLIINSNVEEKSKETQESLPPQFEVNLQSDELVDLLENSFKKHKILKETKVKQQYDIPRNGTVVALSTDVVTFVAQKFND